MGLTEEEKQGIRDLIKESVHENLGAYVIPKDQHYKDHLWLSEWREWQDNIKSNFWKEVVRTVLMVIMGLLLLGFILFGKSNFK